MRSLAESTIRVGKDELERDWHLVLWRSQSFYVVHISDCEHVEIVAGGNRYVNIKAQDLFEMKM